MTHKSLGALGIASTTLLMALPATAQRGDCGGTQPTSWEIEVSGPEEPGRRLVVEGTVFEADGLTPVSGATVFVYHTDAEGYYSIAGEDESNARLCGVMKTDEKGRYRYSTIRPASYPNGGVPQHVHYVVWGEGISRQRSDLHFADDPMVSGRYRAGSPTWSRVQPVEEDDNGVFHVRKDIKLRG